MAFNQRSTKPQAIATGSGAARPEPPARTKPAGFCVAGFVADTRGSVY